VPAESWGTFVGYCVPQLFAVCVLYTEIKISTLIEEMMRFIRKLNLALLLGHPLHWWQAPNASTFYYFVASLSESVKGMEHYLTNCPGDNKKVIKTFIISHILFN